MLALPRLSTLVRLSFLIILLLFASWGTSRAQPQTFVIFESDGGDYIGQGQPQLRRCDRFPAFLIYNTFAILRLDNGVEPIMIQRVSKNAHRLKLAQGFVDRFLNIFPCVFNSLCG
jgi:hypothetical protein